jgi:transcriptional regulator with XRE-family HTH domain
MNQTQTKPIPVERARLGAQIRFWRKRRQLEQIELAGQLGVSRPLISRWESGHNVPDAIELRRLCEMLAVSYDDLLGEGPQTLPARRDSPLLTLVHGGRRASDPVRRQLPMFLTPIPD